MLHQAILCLLCVGSSLSPATPGQLSGVFADYNPIPNPNFVTFTVGSLIQCTTLEIFNDGVPEFPELFLVIASPVGDQISIPDDSSDVIINDADGK